MQRDKWIKTLGQKNKTCPNCGSKNLCEGYIVSNFNENYGWGAVWCEDCKCGIWISRVILKDSVAREKIIPSIPTDLNLF